MSLDRTAADVPPGGDAGRADRRGAAGRPGRRAAPVRVGLRWSYLPPLMVYVAAGISGLTSVVGTFFVKDRFGLSADALAALAFWATLPWALKMPLGHAVDLFWKWKSLLVWAGAALIAASLAIMIGLLVEPAAMRRWASAEAWYVWSSLLGPIGYVMQDVVADAMTVEAVPRVDRAGRPFDEAQRASMHTTMQTLARMAVVGGGLLVAVVNVTMLRDAHRMGPDELASLYASVYGLALAIPVVSVAGVVLGGLQKRFARRGLVAGGLSADDASRRLATQPGRPRADPWVLGGGAAFAAAAIALGVAGPSWSQEAIFVVSTAVIGTLLWRLTGELEAAERAAARSTALVVWIYCATPTAGPALDWWMIDVLGFDEPFLAKLSLTGSVVGLVGLAAFRRFLAERPLHQVLAVLTVLGTALALPFVGMAHGLHEWTAAATDGVVDARFIALVDTTLQSPLSQVALVPMLAWVARAAPERLKATFFAVMVSFYNLATSAAQLQTKWLNRAFVVTREVVDPATGRVVVPADYGRIGDLLLVTTALGLALPLAAIALAVVRERRLRAGG